MYRRRRRRRAAFEAQKRAENLIALSGSQSFQSVGCRNKKSKTERKSVPLSLSQMAPRSDALQLLSESRKARLLLPTNPLGRLFLKFPLLGFQLADSIGCLFIVGSVNFGIIMFSPSPFRDGNQRNWLTFLLLWSSTNLHKQAYGATRRPAQGATHT